MLPILAAQQGAKGASEAKNALTGDLYIKRWQSVQGKGKKKKVVDHELHVNALSLLFATGAAAVAAVGAGLTLWFLQRKVTIGDTGKDKHLVLRYYFTKDEKGMEKTTRVVVLTPQGVPLRTYNREQIDAGMLGDVSVIGLSKRDIANGWRKTGQVQEGLVKGTDRAYGDKTYSTGDYRWYLNEYHTNAKNKIKTTDRTGFLE